MLRTSTSLVWQGAMGCALVAGMGVAAPSARATYTYWDAVVDNAAVVIDTGLHNMTAVQEKDAINANWNHWTAQGSLLGFTWLGQATVAGVYPVQWYTESEIGNLFSLTYITIDPATGQPIPMPSNLQIAAVRWDALLQPFTFNKPDLSEATIRAHLTTLGISTSSGTMFQNTFTLQGFEPQIFAFPLDSSGNEIPGAAGFVAFIPAPGTMAMLGLAGMVVMRRRRDG